MKKNKSLQIIQKRLPNGISIIDETNIEFNDDEIVVILSWVKSFNIHFKEFGFTKNMPLQFAIISKRIRLDFALYRFPSHLKIDLEKNSIYISENGEKLNGQKDSNLTVKKIVNTWKL